MNISYFFRVIIIDVNDNTPKIEVPKGCTSISEFHDIRENIALIKVKDADNPMTPNGRVTIKILRGNEFGEICYR